MVSLRPNRSQHLPKWKRFFSLLLLGIGLLFYYEGKIVLRFNISLEAGKNHALEAGKNHVNMQEGPVNDVEPQSGDSVMSSLLRGFESLAAWQSHCTFVLLVLQAGCHPLLTKLFMPPTIIRTTAILAQECVKFFLGIIVLFFLGDLDEALESWTLYEAVTAAGIPAMLYVIQNYCNLVANQVLPPVTFVVLNQTKTLTTALCCFFILGQKQSTMQVFSLMLQLLAALVVQAKTSSKRLAVSKETAMAPRCHEEGQRRDSPDSDCIPKVSSEFSDSRDGSGVEVGSEKFFWRNTQRIFGLGVLPAVIASFLSGLAGALVQRTLQSNGRHLLVFNMEMATFSCLFLLSSLITGSADFTSHMSDGLWKGWTWMTWAPILSSAFGGILVGLVTQLHGSVVKSFAMILGMALSACLQDRFLMEPDSSLGGEQIVGAILSSVSLLMHAMNPP